MCGHEQMEVIAHVHDLVDGDIELRARVGEDEQERLADLFCWHETKALSDGLTGDEDGLLFVDTSWRGHEMPIGPPR